jgi:hypothetical protein
MALPSWSDRTEIGRVYVKRIGPIRGVEMRFSTAYARLMSARFSVPSGQLVVESLTANQARAQSRAKTSPWMKEHRAQIRKSYGLHLPHTVTSVHSGSNGQLLVTDGPFLEGTEVIGGVAEIEVADLDEALQLAKAFSAAHAPGHPVVEIWPVLEE